MKKFVLFAFAAMTLFAASSVAPKTPNQDPIPVCFPCPEEITF